MTATSLDTQPSKSESARAGRPRRKIRGSGRATPYLFLLPYGVLFIGFIGIPAIYGVYISLHDYDYLLPRQPWVGLKNYTDLFKSGSRDGADFWQSMRATLVFTIFSVPLLVVIPLGVALLLNRKFPGRTFFRAIFFTPFVLGVAVVGVLFRFLLDPNIGVVNHYLHSAGVSRNIPWLTQMPWAWISLVSMTVWWTLGFNSIIYLAGLQDISPELYDAADIDGANEWGKFRNVTLPGLRPVMLFVTTVTILASANMFGQALLVTNGAPGNGTRTAIFYISQVGLRQYRQGAAAAMSYIFAIILILISLVNYRFFRGEQAKT
jgi:multiple sugar transport system permease protein